jgi:pyruvate dehydrogenase E1 component
VIAASDWVQSVPDQIARWVPRRFHSLGTDGFGRSDTREALRRHFRVDAANIAVAALAELAAEGRVPVEEVARARRDLGLEEPPADTAQTSPAARGPLPPPQSV